MVIKRTEEKLPKHEGISKVLVIGSGAIKIGEAGESQ
jgi:hypothetical protein